MFLLFMYTKKPLIRHGQAAGQTEYMPGIIPACSSDDRTQSLYGYDSQCLRSLPPIHSSLPAYEEPPFPQFWEKYTMNKKCCQFFQAVPPPESALLNESSVKNAFVDLRALIAYGLFSLEPFKITIDFTLIRVIPIYVFFWSSKWFIFRYK